MDEQGFTTSIGHMSLRTEKGIAIADLNTSKDDTLGNLAINTDPIQIYLAYPDEEVGEHLINEIKISIENRGDYLDTYTYPIPPDPVPPDFKSETFTNQYMGFYVSKPIEYMGSNYVINGNSPKKGNNRFLFFIEFQILVSLDPKLKGHRVAV